VKWAGLKRALNVHSPNLAPFALMPSGGVKRACAPGPEGSFLLAQDFACHSRRKVSRPQHFTAERPPFHILDADYPVTDRETPLGNLARIAPFIGTANQAVVAFEPELARVVEDGSGCRLRGGPSQISWGVISVREIRGSQRRMSGFTKSGQSKAPVAIPDSHWQTSRTICSALILCPSKAIFGAIMKLPRRNFLRLAAGAAALPAVSRLARAQDYPTRPVRLIVGFAPGGTTDITARLIGQWLSERLGQQFVIENRTGAATNIATEAVVRAPADGYTLLLVTASNAINATLYDKLSFNFIRDIAPANPGKISYGSGGIGTSIHVASELFKMMAGVDMIHVPYRGGASAMTDLMAGQVQVVFNPVPESMEFIKAGKLRPLAVTTATRSEVLPDVPTVGDFVPGYEASALQGIGAPKNTPAEIVDKLNKEINAGLVDPKLKARFADLGAAGFPGSSSDFAKFIATETEKWAKVIKFSGAKAD
jgi:tripartite-type tricarboxylate transporter receptor subunit TctC